MATLYENYTPGTEGGYVLIAGANWHGQTFTPSVAHTITSVKLLLHREGTPGTVTVSIRATDVNGLPDGSDLASGTTDGDTLTSDNLNPEWREITFGTGYDLTANTKYAIVVRAPSASGANRVRWHDDYSSPTYSGGAVVYSFDSGVTWAEDTTGDYNFEEWGDPLAVAFIPKVIFID